jgi:enoyl-CoA hydratase/carnithine racemase
MNSEAALISENPQYVLTEVRGQVGFITLNRPQALNALSLSMIRSLTHCLLAWRDDDRVKAVAIRGSNKIGPFGAFCAGGDIRFFHQAALAASAELGQFFTEEYTLNHLIHCYSKPSIAFMDGIVMGGGMGISQGATIRIVTPRTRMAMPETNIGLFPDVGGGYFLSRCPGRTGEWLALTGQTLLADQALALGLADASMDETQLASAWQTLATLDFSDEAAVKHWLATYALDFQPGSKLALDAIDHYFSLNTVSDIVHALECADDEWARQTAITLRKRSPLMLHVVLEQIRRGRTMTLADDLRMERDLVHHCFAPQHLGRGANQSETVEGIRALAVDKDNAPRWNPALIEQVTPEMVAPFFVSPWTPHAHPLRNLG